MITKVCDRCGQTFMDDEHSVKSEFNALQLVRTNADKTVNVRGNIIDICPECMNRLDDFLNEFKEPEIEEKKSTSFEKSPYGYITGLHRAGHNFVVNKDGTMFDNTSGILYKIDDGYLYECVPMQVEGMEICDWEPVTDN